MKAETWKRTSGSRTAWIVAMAVGVAMLIPIAAHAGETDQSGTVERVPFLSAAIFSDADDGLFVVTGPPFEEGCFGEGFLEPLAKVVTAPDGSSVTTVNYQDHAWVYDNQGFDDPLDWLFGVVCPAIWAGEPAPVALADGQGVFDVNGSVDTDGVEYVSISLKAVVTTADGQDVRLNAFGVIGVTGDMIEYGG